MSIPGSKAVVKAFVGPIPAIGSFVDITANNRTGFDVNIEESDGDRLAANRKREHFTGGFATGTVGFTIDGDDTLRHSSGKVVSYLYAPEGEGSGNPYTLYQTINSLSKDFTRGSQVTYTVNGTIMLEPRAGTFS